MATPTGAYVEITLSQAISPSTTYSFAIKSAGTSSAYFNSAGSGREPAAAGDHYRPLTGRRRPADGRAPGRRSRPRVDAGRHHAFVADAIVNAGERGAGRRRRGRWRDPPAGRPVDHGRAAPAPPRRLPDRAGRDHRRRRPPGPLGDPRGRAALAGRRSGEEALLGGAYRWAMRLAAEAGARTVALPAISAGIYGYPLRRRGPGRARGGPRPPRRVDGHRAGDVRRCIRSTRSRSSRRRSTGCAAGLARSASRLARGRGRSPRSAGATSARPTARPACRPGSGTSRSGSAGRASRRAGRRPGPPRAGPS